MTLSIFLSIEARRFRAYDIWRSRVRLIQQNVWAYAWRDWSRLPRYPLHGFTAFRMLRSDSVRLNTTLSSKRASLQYLQQSKLVHYYETVLLRFQ